MLKAIEKANAEHRANMERINEERAKISAALREIETRHQEARATWESDSVQAALDGEPQPPPPERPDVSPLRNRQAALNAEAERSHQESRIAVAAAGEEVEAEAREKLAALSKKAAKVLVKLDELVPELVEVTGALRDVESARNSANPNRVVPPRVRGSDLSALIRLVRHGEKFGIDYLVQGEPSEFSKAPSPIGRRW